MINLNNADLLIKLHAVSITIEDFIVDGYYHVKIKILNNSDMGRLLEVIELLGFKDKRIGLESDEKGIVTAVIKVKMPQ